MSYNRKRHIELVKYAQSLKTQGKIIFIENREASRELLEYDIEVEEQVFWTHREEFCLLMKNLLNDIINFEKFEIAFSLLYRKTTEEFETYKRNLNKIETFMPSTQSYRFASIVSSIFRQFELIEDEYYTEQDVRNSVKKFYLDIQNSLTFYL